MHGGDRRQHYWDNCTHLTLLNTPWKYDAKSIIIFWVFLFWTDLLASSMAYWHRISKCEKAVPLTNHMLTDMSHSVELLLTDITWELLFGITMHNLNVLMQWPQLLKRLVAGNTLNNKKNKHKKLENEQSDISRETWLDNCYLLQYYTPAPSAGIKQTWKTFSEISLETQWQQQQRKIGIFSIETWLLVVIYV